MGTPPPSMTSAMPLLDLHQQPPQDLQLQLRQQLLKTQRPKLRRQTKKLQKIIRRLKQKVKIKTLLHLPRLLLIVLPMPWPKQERRDRATHQLSPHLRPLANVPTLEIDSRNYCQILKKLDGDNADEKIPTIKELVRILNEALPTLNTICTKEKKNELKANTTADVQTAKEKTTKYKEKKEKKIQDLVVKVQIAQEKIKVSNEKLVASGSTKIPALTIPIIAINFTVANPFSYVTQLPPEPTTPIGSSPNGQGTSPGQGSSAPGGSTPGGSSLGGSSPGGSSPGGSSPGGSSPGG